MKTSLFSAKGMPESSWIRLLGIKDLQEAINKAEGSVQSLSTSRFKVLLECGKELHACEKESLHWINLPARATLPSDLTEAPDARKQDPLRRKTKPKGRHWTSQR
jgi:hypothetical protein